jgi:5,10-methenyltetrahydrofolate synthetase
MVKERKKTLRKEILEKRKSLSEEQIKDLSHKVVENLKKLPEFRRAKTVMLYFPIKGEVDLTELIEELVKDNSKILLLPKVTADGEMVAVEVKDLEILKKGKYGKFLACSGYPECENVKPLFTKKGGKRFNGKGKNQRHKKNT